MKKHFLLLETGVISSILIFGSLSRTSSGNSYGGKTDVRTRTVRKCAPNFHGGVPSSGNNQGILSTLTPEHPRLYISTAQLPVLRNIIQTDPHARLWYSGLQARAKQIMAYPEPTPQLLAGGRQTFEFIATLAGIYTLDGDLRKRDRAIALMRAIAQLPTWQPEGDYMFLENAERMQGMAVGYDWLYNELSADDRNTFRNAIANLGLRAAAKNRPACQVGWNVGQVCNGAVVSAALAIGDEESQLATNALENAIADVKTSLARFAPSGSWYEGLTYWRYATEYSTLLMAGLQSALGHDAGLHTIQGVSETGAFLPQLLGPSGRAFAYGDSWERLDTPPPQMFWFARQFDRPEYMHEETRHVDGYFLGQEPFLAPTWYPVIFHLFWYDPGCQSSEAPVEPFPRARFIPGIVDLAFIRTAWNDPNAFYVAFKGGHSTGMHQHPDVGNFVFEALGRRWATDFGVELYEAGCQEEGNCYRRQSEGHNVMTISKTPQQPFANKNQKQETISHFLAYSSTPSRWLAVTDMNTTYEGVSSARRGIELLDQIQLVVQDEITAPEPVEVLWNFHTEAEVRIAPRVSGRVPTATLRQQNVSMIAEILSPLGASFETVSANPCTVIQPCNQNENIGITNLVVRLPNMVTSATITVRIYPASSSIAPPVSSSLDEWIATGPLSQP